MTDTFVAKITPLDTQAVPPFVATVETVNPPDPEPPGGLPEPKAQWVYNGDGWYFTWGPFDKPRSLGALGNFILLDPTKSDWKTLDGQGWTFVSGPYDKPIQVIGVPNPPTEPPTEPPVSEGCKWHYTDGGWVLICGPFAGGKPQPPMPNP